MSRALQPCKMGLIATRISELWPSEVKNTLFRLSHFQGLLYENGKDPRYRTRGSTAGLGSYLGSLTPGAHTCIIPLTHHASPAPQKLFHFSMPIASSFAGHHYMKKMTKSQSGITSTVAKDTLQVCPINCARLSHLHQADCLFPCRSP